MIPGIPQQSLYPSLAAVGTSINTVVTPPIPFSRRVINDIQEEQRKALEDTVAGTVRSTNTSLILEVEEQAEEAIVLGTTSQAGMTQADTQEETATGVFRDRRHQHKGGQYTYRPKYRTHRSPEYI